MQRQTGLLPQAVASFKHVRDTAPPEALPPVLLSLAETQLALAQHERATSFLARAPESFLDAIATSLELINIGAQYKRSAWKVAADVLLGLAEFDAFDDSEMVLGRLAKIVGNRTSDRLTGILHYPLVPEGRRAIQLDGSVARKLLVATCT